MTHLICGYAGDVDKLLAAYERLKTSVSNLRCLAICCERLGRDRPHEASGYLMEATNTYDSIGDQNGRAFSIHRRARIIYKKIRRFRIS